MELCPHYFIVCSFKHFFVISILNDLQIYVLFRTFSFMFIIIILLRAQISLHFDGFFSFCINYYINKHEIYLYTPVSSNYSQSIHILTVFSLRHCKLSAIDTYEKDHYDEGSKIGTPGHPHAHKPVVLPGNNISKTKTKTNYSQNTKKAANGINCKLMLKYHRYKTTTRYNHVTD